MKVINLFFIIFSMQLILLNDSTADEDNNPKEIHNTYQYNSTQAEVTWKFEGEFYITRLKVDGKSVKEWMGTFISDKFLRSQLVNRYLVMVWLKGVHGERVSIYDVKYKKFIWGFNSTWPINVLKDDKQLSIEYFDEIQNADRGFKKFTKTIPF